MHSNAQAIMPPAWIGIIGGGQLGKMLTLAAQNWGYKVVILDPNPASPAGAVAHKHLCYPYEDLEGLALFKALASVITYEFEHLPMAMFDHLEKSNIPIIPSPNTLRVIQDKYLQKCHLKDHGLPVALDQEVKSVDQVKDFMDQFGPGIIKPRLGGYDGKGTYFVREKDQVEGAFDQFKDLDLYIEQLVDFEMEISIMVAKSTDATYTFPVSENIHNQGILITSIVPARISKDLREKAQAIASQAIDSFKSIGLFCVEMFVTRQGDILINEIAPRAHNSGHYTIEACGYSQFDQWLRILTGLPLGQSKVFNPSVMINILGPEARAGLFHLKGLETISSLEDVYFHWYGKVTTSHRRKLGHITVLNPQVDQALEDANRALEALIIEER